LPLDVCCLFTLAAARFTRIQQEAGIKSSAHAADGDMDGMDVDDEDAAAAAVLSKSGGLANLLDELLEGDFDPEAYDKRMAAAFDDDYYQVGVLGCAGVCCAVVLLGAVLVVGCCGVGGRVDAGGSVRAGSRGLGVLRWRRGRSVYQGSVTVGGWHSS
jgi:hypothetical protein